MSELESRLRTLLGRTLEPPTSLDSPLELSSLELIQLAELLEDELEIRILAKDMLPENFGTLGGLCRFVESKKSSG